MAKVTISMPDRMSDYVAVRVEEGQYGNVSEFFRDLVRRDQERRRLTMADLRALIDVSEASGDSGRQVPEIMREVEAKLRADGQL